MNKEFSRDEFRERQDFYARAARLAQIGTPTTHKANPARRLKREELLGERERSRTQPKPLPEPHSNRRSKAKSNAAGPMIGSRRRLVIRRYRAPNLFKSQNGNWYAVETTKEKSKKPLAAPKSLDGQLMAMMPPTLLQSLLKRFKG